MKLALVLALLLPGIQTRASHAHISNAPAEYETYQNASFPPYTPNATAYPPLWPHPAQFSNGSASVIVDSVGFIFTTTTPCDDLSAAFDRYRAVFFPRRVSAQLKTSLALNTLVVNVKNTSGEVQLYTDEAYNLTVPSDGSAVIITANTLLGAYHGLQTLSQLIVFDYSKGVYSISDAPWNIVDYPRFKHREVII